MKSIIGCPVDPTLDSKTAINEVHNILKEHGLVYKRRKKNRGAGPEEYSIDKFSALVSPKAYCDSWFDVNGLCHFVYFVSHCITTQFTLNDCLPKRLSMQLWPAYQIYHVKDTAGDTYSYDYLEDEPMVETALVSMNPNGNWRECVNVESTTKLNKSMRPSPKNIVGNALSP